MKYPKQTYIDFDPFFGDESDISLRTVKIVKTRKPHLCFSYDKTTQHEIPAGSFARHEKALFDGDYFGSYYWCTYCLDKEISELNGETVELIKEAFCDSKAN